MLNSTVLEVAIGLVFCYASMALIASSLYEAIASLFKLRAKTLLAGVKALLNDKAFTGLALDVYNHALVNPREVGKTDASKAPSVTPSYIEPRSFAIALIDSIQGAPAVFGELKTKIDAVEDVQIKTLLQGMYARADGSLANMETSLASWFDDGMNRVSGGYKRQAQLFTFLITLVLAGLLNVDTFHLFQSLWEHPTLAARDHGDADARCGGGFRALELFASGVDPQDDLYGVGLGGLAGHGGGGPVRRPVLVRPPPAPGQPARHGDQTRRQRQTEGQAPVAPTEPRVPRAAGVRANGTRSAIPRRAPPRSTPLAFHASGLPPWVRVPPVVFTRSTLPGGKCGGSVQVQVVASPEVAGETPESSLPPRQ